MPETRTAAAVFDQEFLPIRAKLLEVAAALDPLRPSGWHRERRSPLAQNPRCNLHAARVPQRPRRTNPIDLQPPVRRRLAGEFPNDERRMTNAQEFLHLIRHSSFESTFWLNSRVRHMYYIDPHIHMVSRTTDDYETLAKMGCVGVSEPAFWAGFDRGSVDGFRDYFRQLTEFEPKRAGWYGIQHYTWLCINAKEAENVAPVARSDRHDPRVPRPARRAGHRRDRPQQEHPQRGDRLPGAPRPGRCRPTSRSSSTRRTWRTSTRARG